MNTNNTQTVAATAPVIKITQPKTWAEILAEKLSPKEISEFKQSINDVYIGLHTDSELLVLLALDKKYTAIDWELNNEKYQCNREKDSLDTLAIVYPEILDKCPDIQTNIQHKYDDLRGRNHIFNDGYFEMLQAEQEKLKEVLKDNLDAIKVLDKCNKQTRAAEAANPNLKMEKSEMKILLAQTNKAIRKKIKDNDKELPVFTIKEAIESISILIFTRTRYGRFNMGFDNDDISIDINEKVSLFKKGTGYLYSEVLGEFDIDKFCYKLPKKYWYAKLRDQKIDSILMD